MCPSGEIKCVLKQKDALKHRFHFISLFLSWAELSWSASDTQWQLRSPLPNLNLLQRSVNSRNSSGITAKSVPVSFLNNKVKRLSGSQFQLQPLHTVSLPDSPSLVHSKLVIYEPHTHQHATGASSSQVMIRLFFFFLLMRNKRGHFTAVTVKPHSVAWRDEHNVAVTVLRFTKGDKSIAPCSDNGQWRGYFPAHCPWRNASRVSRFFPFSCLPAHNHTHYSIHTHYSH